PGGAKFFDVRSASGTRTRDNLFLAVAKEVACRHRHSTLEPDIVRVEIRQLAAVKAADCLHFRSASGPRTDDHVRVPIAVEVLGGHVSAAVKERIEGHKFRDERTAPAIEHANIRTAAKAWRGNNIVHTIAVDVADGNAHATVKRRGIGQEIHHEGTSLDVK